MPRIYRYGGRRHPLRPPGSQEPWQHPGAYSDAPSPPGATISGTLQQFNRSAGTWGLFTAAGVTTGKIAADGPTMDGLEVGSYYQFNCIEEIEIDFTGREKRTLYLQSIADA